MLHHSPLLEICNLVSQSTVSQLKYKSCPSGPSLPPAPPSYLLLPSSPSATVDARGRTTHPACGTLPLQPFALDPTRLLRLLLLPDTVHDAVALEAGEEVVAGAPAVGARLPVRGFEGAVWGGSWVGVGGWWGGGGGGEETHS